MFDLSIKYGVKILFGGDVSFLFSFSDSKRNKVLKATSNLAKYLGVYNQWKELRERYSLKWSNGKKCFTVFFREDFKNLVEECRKIINVLERRFYHEVRFIACSGLRPSESLASIRLYHLHGEKYLNKELMILEHYKFPETFIRKTKNAYITVLDEELLHDLEKSEAISYNALKCFLKRNSMNIKLNFFRKLYASYLRERGVLTETIDLLQGRLPQNVFMRSYFRPNFSLAVEEVRKHLKGLRETLFL